MIVSQWYSSFMMDLGIPISKTTQNFLPFWAFPVANKSQQA
jgi:hypothetical protein